MDRLTERRQSGGVAARRSEYGVCCSNYCNNCPKGTSECEELKAMIDRLAAYEDTGLEPSEIAHLRKQLHGYVKQCLHYEKQLKAYSSLGTVEELSELVKAKRDGRCVVLPCKVGDAVYKHWKVGGKTEIGSALVTGFEIANDGINYCYRVKRFDRKETIKKFGKTVFLTRAEAEAALQKEAQHE